MQPDTKTSQDNKGKDKPGESLRRLAEKRMSETAGGPAPPIRKEDMKKLIHELQVSRIELEIQNEGLIQARDEVEALLGRSTSLYDFAPVGYFTLDHQGTIHNVNLAGAALLGLERSLLVDRRFPAFVSEDSLPVFNAFMKTVFEQETKQSCDVELRNRNDQPIVVRIEADVAGAGKECFMAVTDITERKRAEEALRESEERLHLTLDATNDGLWDWDIPSGKAVFSPRWYTMLGFEDGEMPADYATFTRLVHPEDIDPVEATIQDHIQQKSEGYAIELRMRTKNGDWKWILTRGKVVERDAGGQPVRMIGTHTDITDRRMMEEEIRSLNKALEQRVVERTSQLNASLEEKVHLLREIHHRVKNNLQIIISLLNLQSRYVEDEKTQQLIRESQNRIKAMALVHEKLYQSGDISKINLDDYVRFLGNSLFQFYGMKGKGITLNTRIFEIHIGISTAIPVGLIINELVSNSLKHAFPDRKKGEISLAITREDAVLNLVYKDNGVGIPQDLDLRNTKSLGLRLVITLVEQLQGTIELDRSSGTKFTIVVREKE
jgi:PAS domain S-box-containing protein